MKNPAIQRKINSLLEKSDLFPVDILIALREVVVVVQTTTTTYFDEISTLAQVKDLLNLCCSYPKAIDYIIDRKAFTQNILQYELMLNKNQSRRLINKLLSANIIKKVDRIKIRGKTSAGSIIYALMDANARHIIDAKSLHVDVQPTNVPRPLESFDYQQSIENIVEEGIIEHEKSVVNWGKFIPNEWITKKILEELGSYEESTYLTIKRELTARGWGVMIR